MDISFVLGSKLLIFSERKYKELAYLANNHILITFTITFLHSFPDIL